MQTETLAAVLVGITTILGIVAIAITPLAFIKTLFDNKEKSSEGVRQLKGPIIG